MKAEIRKRIEEARARILNGEPGAADYRLRRTSALHLPPASSSPEHPTSAGELRTPDAEPRTPNSELRPLPGSTTPRLDDSTAPIVLNVARLAEEYRALIEETLIEGGTIEDAVEVVQAEGGPEIEPEAVARLFNARIDLQTGRVQHMIAAAEQVEAGGANGGETGKQLLRAAVMTGLMRTRRGMRLTLGQAVNAGLARENLALRNEKLEMEIRKDRRDALLNTQYVNREIQRTKLLRLQVLQLKKLVDEEKPDLKPHLMDKIHEIYGLAALPDIPAAGDE